MDTTPSFLKRCAENPILSAADIPYDASLIFNAGVTKYNGKYVMAFRNDYGSKEEQWRECVAKKKDRMPPLKTSIGILPAVCTHSPLLGAMRAMSGSNTVSLRAKIYKSASISTFPGR